MSKGLLYCAAKNTDCMEIYLGGGTCKRATCVRDDPEYLAKEQAKEVRRRELYKKSLRHKKEEQEAARKIRRQTRTKADQLREEITHKRRQMERYYTRGLTKLGNKASRELADLERRLEKEA